MQKKISKMSVEEKVGQLFMVDYSGSKISGELTQLLTTYRVGGVHLQNIIVQKRQQLNHLNTYMQYYAGVTNPLFIAADIINTSISKGLTTNFNQQTLMQLNNSLYTKQVTSVRASELRALGVNMAFSMMNHNESNDFHTETKHGLAIIQGLQKENISAIASSFPTENEIEPIPRYPYDSPKSYLYPFYKAAEAGVDVIQLSNVALPITELLRNRCDFSGVIMYRLQIGETIVEDALEAIQAGVNMLILPGTYQQQITVLNHVLEAIKKNTVVMNQIDLSLEKILSLKTKRQVDQLIPYDDKYFGTFFARRVAENVSDKVAQLVI